MTLVPGADVAEAKTAEESLRNLAARLLAVREEERTRIAREIHDDLGAKLTALKLDLGWQRMKSRQREGEPDERVEERLRLIDSALQSVRRICSDLRPSLLDQFGLVAAIQWQARDFEKRVGIPCEVVCPLDDALNPRGDVATAIFRIVQEALTNIARHAQAQHAWINLGIDGYALEVEIADDGKGMGALSGPRPGSLGITGMSERARMYGGTIGFLPRAPRGTLVRVTFNILDLAEQLGTAAENEARDGVDARA
jgi:two-component system, NarL family, sensor histidine kinase UhpB